MLHLQKKSGKRTSGWEQLTEMAANSICMKVKRGFITARGWEQLPEMREVTTRWSTTVNPGTWTI